MAHFKRVSGVTIRLLAFFGKGGRDWWCDVYSSGTTCWWGRWLLGVFPSTALVLMLDDDRGLESPVAMASPVAMRSSSKSPFSWSPCFWSFLSSPCIFVHSSSSRKKRVFSSAARSINKPLEFASRARHRLAMARAKSANVILPCDLRCFRLGLLGCWSAMRRAIATRSTSSAVKGRWSIPAKMRSRSSWKNRLYADRGRTGLVESSKSFWFSFSLSFSFSLVTLLVLAWLQLSMVVLWLWLRLWLIVAEALAVPVACDEDAPEDAATLESELSVSYMGCCFKEGDDSMAFMAVSISNPKQSSVLLSSKEANESKIMLLISPLTLFMFTLIRLSTGQSSSSTNPPVMRTIGWWLLLLLLLLLFMIDYLPW